MEATLMDILGPDQWNALCRADKTSKLVINNTGDDELLTIKHIDQEALKKIRDWAALPPYKEGDAICLRPLILKRQVGEPVVISPDTRRFEIERLCVLPGDVIPADWEPGGQIEKGNARLRRSDE